MDPEAYLAVNVIIHLVFGAITAAIGVSKGRSGVGWFFVGFFVTCIGLIIVLCMSNLKDEQERWARSDRERRRLQEQLRQERLKNEAFQKHVHLRLDRHDEVLQVDTRQLGSGGRELAAIEQDASTASDAIDATTETAMPEPSSFARRHWTVEWVYQEKKAMSFAALKDYFAARRIDESTLVWTDGMAEWKRIADVPGLLEALL
jgi:hypothetical protein